MTASHRYKRALRTVALASASAVGWFVALIAIVLGALQFPGIATTVLNLGLPRLLPWRGGVTRVKSVDLHGIGRLTLTGLEFQGPEGSPRIAVDSLRLRLDPFALIHRRLEVSDLYVEGLTVATRQVRHGSDSTWDVLEPFTTQAAAGPGGSAKRVAVRVARADVRAARLRASFLTSGDSTLGVDIRTLRLDTLAFPTPVALDVDTVDARIRPPGGSTGAARLAGSLTLHGGVLHTPGLHLRSDSSDVSAQGTLRFPRSGGARGIDFKLSAAPLALRDVAALIPELPPAGAAETVRLTGRVTGSASLLHMRADAETSRGGVLHVEGSFTPTTADSVRYDIAARVRHLDPAAWWSASPAVNALNADVQLKLVGSSLDSLDGHATLQVKRASLDDDDIRATRLALSFRRGVADLDAHGTVRPWGQWRARGRVHPFGGRPSYQIRVLAHQTGTLHKAGTRLTGADVEVDAHGTGIAPRQASGTLTARLSGTVGTAALTGGRVTASWDSAAARVDVGLPVGDGHVSAHGRVAWGGTAAQLLLRSFDVDSLDVGAVLGDTVAGTFSLHGRGELVAGNPLATHGDLHAVLESGSWRRLDVDTGAVAVHVKDGVLSARTRLVAPAGTVTAWVGGRPFDATPTWRVDSLRMRKLDLADVRAGLPTTSLSGLLALQAKGPSADSLHAHGSLTLDSSVVAGVPVAQATTRFALNEGASDFSGTARVGGGSMRWHAEGRPFDRAPVYRLASARFDSIPLDIFGGTPARGTASGTLDARVSLPPDTFPRLSARLALDGGRLNGDAVQDGTLTVDIRGGDATADGHVHLQGGGADVHASATLSRASGSLALRNVALHGTADLPRPALVLPGDPRVAALHARFALGSQGNPSAPEAWHAALSGRGRYGAATLDSLDVRARLRAGRLFLDTLVVASNVARGGGGGTLVVDSAAAAASPDTTVPGTSPRRGIHIHLDAERLDPLGALLGAGTLAARSASLRLDAERDGPGVRVTGAAAVGGGITGHFSADTAWADFTGHLNGRRVRSASLTVHGREMALPAGVVRVADGRVRYDSAGTAAGAVDIRGQGEHHLRVVGAVRVGDRAVRLDTVQAALSDTRWHLARPTTLRWGERLDAGGLTLVSGKRSVALSGHLDRRGAQNLTVRLDSLPLAGLADLAGMRRVTGLVDGSLTLTGPAARPRVDGSLRTVLDGARGVVKVGSDSASAAVNGSAPTGLRIDARLEDPDGRAMTARGQVPFHLSLAMPDTANAAAPTAEAPTTPGAVSLAIRSDSVKLGWLAPVLEPLGVASLGGRLTARARWRGTREDPDISGTARLTEGKLSLSGQGVSYDGIHALMAFDGDTVHVDSLRVTSGGTATLDGVVGLDSLSDPTLHLHAHFHRFHAVDNAWADARLSGNASVSGALRAPAVTGSVLLEGTDIYIDELGQGGNVEPVTLAPQDYRMLESYFGYRPSPKTAAGSDLLEPWKLDVTVRLGSDAWLRRRTQPKIAVQLGGSVEVRKAAGDSLRLFGTIASSTQRSYVEEFGRRFSLTRGSVTFDGAPAGFQVDARATYDVPSYRDPSALEVVITLDVQGTLNHLDLTLGSKPSMDNADIVSYLATGRPAESAIAAVAGTSSGSSGLSGGGSGGILGLGEKVAFGQVAGLVENAAQRAVGLDVVEVRPDGADGATLVAGRYVNPRLFVGFRQPLSLNGRAGDATQGALDRTEVNLEYTWYHWLLVSLQGGQSALRFFFRTRWAF